MRIGFVTLGANVPSTRFRFYPYEKPLADRGHRVSVWTCYPSVYDYFTTIGWRFSSHIKRASRLVQYSQAKWFRPDTVYLERGVFHDQSLWLDRWFRNVSRRFVLDVDDAIFLQFPEKTRQLIQWSDHVVVSNQPLYEYVSQFHSKITEIPTCVSLERYRLKAFGSSESSKPVIGWMGTPSNLPFLVHCAPALRRLAKELPFKLLVVSNTSEPLKAIDLQGVDLQFETWSPQVEIQWLHRMDIGLMPLPADQEWMRYKAATKLVQYMSIGIPAVASPIGVNATILKDNQVGFAAANDQQWFESLRTLLLAPDLRQRMGIAGRALVESKYCIEANLDKLEQVLVGD
ncbi:MAG: glycosyltransferase family 4 protein [Planctomycetota bacterium]|jgi:glycosyltransferase involved in cell wall biosynthesis